MYEVPLIEPEGWCNSETVRIRGLGASRTISARLSLRPSDHYSRGSRLHLSTDRGYILTMTVASITGLNWRGAAHLVSMRGCHRYKHHAARRRLVNCGYVVDTLFGGGEFYSYSLSEVCYTMLSY